MTWSFQKDVLLSPSEIFIRLVQNQIDALIITFSYVFIRKKYTVYVNTTIQNVLCSIIAKQSLTRVLKPKRFYSKDFKETT